MSNLEETNELLREIRDLLLRREQKYEEHLEKSRQTYEEMTRQAQSTHWRNAWKFALIIAAIVFLLLLLSSLAGQG